MKRNKRKCNNCNRLISLSNFKRHYKACTNKNQIKPKIDKYKIQENKYKCNICGKVFSKNGISPHIWGKHGAGQDLVRTAWNKGLTQNNDERVRKNTRHLKRTIKKQGFCWLGRKHSKETKEKLRLIALNNNFEKHITKHRKNFYYEHNGETILLQSSFELRIAKILDENNIQWNRPLPLSYIDSNNIKRKYYPDFYLPEYNIFLDPKNDYLAKKDKQKIESVKRFNNVKVFILTENQLNINYLIKLLHTPM